MPMIVGRAKAVSNGYRARKTMVVALVTNLLFFTVPQTAMCRASNRLAISFADGLKHSIRNARSKIRASLPEMILVSPTGSIPIPILLASVKAQMPSTAPPSPLSVSTVSITPFRQAAFVGDRVAYTAQARDSGSALVHGVKPAWSSPDSALVNIDEAGRAIMLAPGLARVMCTVGQATATALVIIRPGTRRAQTDAEWGEDQGGAASSIGGSNPRGPGNYSLGRVIMDSLRGPHVSWEEEYSPDGWGPGT